MEIGKHYKQMPLPQLVYEHTVAYTHLETPSCLLSQSIGAAITKCHRLGDL